MAKPMTETTAQRFISVFHISLVMGFLAMVSSVGRILACIIHKYCRALACSFVRNESLVGRPYAWLWSSSSEFVANKVPAHKKAEGRLDELQVARRVRDADPNQLSR